METLMLIGLFIVFAYTIALVSTLTYDVFTGRIKRLQGIAYKEPEAPPLFAKQE
jgi:hypothetical protein